MANVSGVTVDTSLSSAPSNNGVTLVDIGSSTSSGRVTSDKLTFGTGNSITFGAATNGGAESGVYYGSVSGIAAAPYNTSRNYYAAEPGAGVTFSYAATQHYFGIDWGSVDSYNTLSFYNGSTLIYTLTGSQVLSSASGSQNADGTYYVNMNFSGTGFTSVVASTTSPAFEFATVASSTTTIPLTANQTGKPTTVQAIDTGTGKPVCFLAGTRIRTLNGEIDIADLYERFRTGRLEPGDHVVTVADSGHASQPIRWMGRRHISAREAARTKDYPVCVKQNAVAPGVPCRDLRITPEHCLSVEGLLIPARMLVNGSSIVEETATSGFDIYHLELERHSVLLAERMTAESYLDTGNRSSFSDQAVTSLQPAFGRSVASQTSSSHHILPQNWEDNACAPLATDRVRVEPIWQRFADRAVQLGLSRVPPAKTGGTESYVRLQLDDGQVIGPDGPPGAHTLFRIPHGTRPVRLISHVTVPADAIGPFIDDRRELGLKVKGLVFWVGLESCRIPAASLEAPGWHALEDDARWTNGAAALDLPSATDDYCFLEVELADGLVVGQSRETRNAGVLAA